MLSCVAEALQSKRSGIFTGEFLPESDIMYGTDASGGPRGADARLRLVSWAVVAIRKAAPGGANDFEVLGSITGSLQIGATVNEGESAAINELALWVGGPVKVAVDSKVAIKWCHKPQVHLQAPEIWTADQRQRGNLELAGRRVTLKKRNTVGDSAQDSSGLGLPTRRRTRDAMREAQICFPGPRAKLRMQ